MNLVDITIILDRSGSMATAIDDTIGGFNSYVQTQKKSGNNVKLTLIQFNGQSEVKYSGTPIEYVPYLSKATYVPSGYTALLDSVGEAIDNAGRRFAEEPNKNRQVVFVIITDGNENASHKYDRQKIFNMISHQKEKYSWDFIFIGADIDSFKNAKNIGIDFDKTMNFTKSKIGTRSVYESLSRITGSYASGDLRATNFTEEERNKAVSG